MKFTQHRADHDTRQTAVLVDNNIYVMRLFHGRKPLFKNLSVSIWITQSVGQHRSYTGPTHQRYISKSSNHSSQCRHLSDTWQKSFSTGPSSFLARLKSPSSKLLNLKIRQPIPVRTLHFISPPLNSHRPERL